MNGLAVSLRGRARYSAQRRSPFSAGVNEGGTTQALLRPLGRGRLFFAGRKRRKPMNLNAEMLPGLCILIAGALISVLSERVCRKQANVPQVRLLGAGLAVIGAILIFLP